MFYFAEASPQKRTADELSQSSQEEIATKKARVIEELESPKEQAQTEAWIFHSQ